MSIKIPWLGDDMGFPPVESALDSPNGLLAAGGDLTPQRLIAAYSRGIFPWYSGNEPILWWSPDPRTVLFPAELKISRSLAKTLRNARYSIRFDGDFDAVVQACAAPRAGQPGTWITREMREAYGHLHRMGHAHCVETWMDGRLAGGLYGVALGGAFFGESMFSAVRDASKLALVALARHLQQLGYGLIDCQVHSPHLASLGARCITRREFSDLLRELINFRSRTEVWTAATYVHEPAKLRPCQS
jgi:leucyl/phenylalanyl-tRNA--protein transferase